MLKQKNITGIILLKILILKEKRKGREEYMSKKYIIIFVLAAVIASGIIVGVILGGNDKTSNLKPEIDTKLATENKELEDDIQIVTTSNIKVKTSPNTLFIFKTYYKDCNHTKTKKIEIPKEFVNQTEEKIQEKYRDWKIEEFTSSEVIFYEEQEGICNEHYVIRENNGYVAIYTIDSLAQETLKETTEIVTSYLPETDKQRLQEGIKVIGQESLNATIEDYE